MFYTLSKTLDYLLSPAGGLTLLLVLAGGLRNARWRRRVLLALALSWFVLGNEFLASELARAWERGPVSLPASPRPRVGIVLTGGMMQTDVPPFDRVILGESSDRMGQAFLLYRQGLIQKILISGGADPLDGRRVGNEGRLVAYFLAKAGVRPADILLENRSRNTEENARFTAAVVQRHFPAHDYVLITSAFHMRRAEGCFRRQGVAVRPWPTSFLAQQRRFTPGVLLLPTESALWRNARLFHEWFGYAVYAALGYL